jgi:hypothetical protein
MSPVGAAGGTAASSSTMSTSARSGVPIAYDFGRWLTTTSTCSVCSGSVSCIVTNGSDTLDAPAGIVAVCVMPVPPAGVPTPGCR